MDTYSALIELDGPNDIHKRVSVEAESLAQAKRLLEEQFGEGKIVSLIGDKAATRIR